MSTNYTTLNETIYESDDGLRRAVICGRKVYCEDNPSSKYDRDETIYGQTAPLTRAMALEIAQRFVDGRKIPKRLEWR
jgi:hypothetical protein